MSDKEENWDEVPEIGTELSKERYARMTPGQEGSRYTVKNPMKPDPDLLDAVKGVMDDEEVEEGTYWHDTEADKRDDGHHDMKHWSKSVLDKHAQQRTILGPKAHAEIKRRKRTAAYQLRKGPKPKGKLRLSPSGLTREDTEVDEGIKDKAKSYYRTYKNARDGKKTPKKSRADAVWQGVNAVLDRRYDEKLKREKANKLNSSYDPSFEDQTEDLTNMEIRRDIAARKNNRAMFNMRKQKRIRTLNLNRRD